MTNKQKLRLARFYQTTLETELQITAKQFPLHVNVSDEAATGWTPSALAHAAWMLEQWRDFVDPEKADRWLGFVQGVLWAQGVYTIDELRGHIKKLGGNT